MKKQYSKQTIVKIQGKAKVGIVQAGWHAEHTDRMIAACSDILIKSGVKSVKKFAVPGCYEIPLMSKKLARTKKFDALIVFGAIVRGDTDHYHLILETCIRELGKVMYDFEIPIINEILPVNNIEHLIERSAGKGNKGIEAAQAAIAIINALRAV